MDFLISAKFIILYDHEDKILLEKIDGSYVLPGIRINPGEPILPQAKNFLKKKLNIEAEASRNLYFIGNMEEIENGNSRLSFVFKVDCKGQSIDIKDPKYNWSRLPLEHSISFMPVYLKDDLSRWLKGKEIFLSTEDKAFSA